MLLWLSACVWIGNPTHDQRMLERTRIEAISAFQQCETTGATIRGEAPDALVDRTLTVEVRLDGELLTTTTTTVVRDGDSGRFLVPLDELPRLDLTLDVAEVTLRLEDEQVQLSHPVVVEPAPQLWADADADGYGAEMAETCAPGAPLAGDCNDAAPAINPGAVDQPGPLDIDCDGHWLCGLDADEDGFAPLDTLQMVPAGGTCPVPGGELDCDDTDPQISPDATEIFDAIDNNCDGLYACSTIDVDGDGFVDPTVIEMQSEPCEAEPDCDDTQGVVNPASIDRCGPVDEDCDPTTDGQYTLLPPGPRGISIEDYVVALNGEATIELCSPQSLPPSIWNLNHDLTIVGVDTDAVLVGSTRVEYAGPAPRPHITLRDVTMQAGEGIFFNPFRVGGAISVQSIDLSLERVEVDCTQSSPQTFIQYGGGIATAWSDLTIDGSTFRGCQSILTGGAISLFDSDVSFEGAQTVFDTNTNAIHTTGGRVFGSGDGVSFIGNTANTSTQASALTIGADTINAIDVEEWRFEGNTGGVAAVDVRSQHEFACTQCVFESNDPADIQANLGAQWSAPSLDPTTVTCSPTQGCEAP